MFGDTLFPVPQDHPTMETVLLTKREALHLAGRKEWERGVFSDKIIGRAYLLIYTSIIYPLAEQFSPPNPPLIPTDLPRKIL